MVEQARFLADCWKSMKFISSFWKKIRTSENESIIKGVGGKRAGTGGRRYLKRKGNKRLGQGNWFK